MRKSILGIITLLALALFIASCTPAAQYYICSDGRKVSDPAMCPPPVNPEQPKAQAVPENPVDETMISEAAQKLFSNLARVSTVSFAHVESPAVLPDKVYAASRQRMKVTLMSKERFTVNDAYDTVYLDLVNKTAVAYCENRDDKVCPNRDNEYPVDFEDYFVETPFGWVDKLTKADLTNRSKTIENRDADEVLFEIDGESGVMFAARFYGLPLFVTFGGKTYEFRDMATNTLKATDLEHQFIVE
jgi:hypothetical protein